MCSWLDMHVLTATCRLLYAPSRDWMSSVAVLIPAASYARAARSATTTVHWASPSAAVYVAHPPPVHFLGPGWRRRVAAPTGAVASPPWQQVEESYGAAATDWVRARFLPRGLHKDAVSWDSVLTCVAAGSLSSLGEARAGRSLAVSRGSSSLMALSCPYDANERKSA